MYKKYLHSLFMTFGKFVLMFFPLAFLTTGVNAHMLPHSLHMSPLPLEMLVDDSSHIVEAQLIDIKSQWTNDRKAIISKARFKVDSVLLGKIGSEIITVYAPGGTVDGIRQIVTGAPTFEPGEKSLLMLRKLNSDEFKKGIDSDSFNITSLSLGKFSLVVDKNSGEMKARSNALNYFDKGIMTQYKSGDLLSKSGMSLEQLRQKIKELANK